MFSSESNYSPFSTLALCDKLRSSAGKLPEPVRQQWQDNRLLAQPLRRAFNQAIDQYNHAIHQWPASMVARVFQFQSAQGLSELA